MCWVDKLTVNNAELQRHLNARNGEAFVSEDILQLNIGKRLDQGGDALEIGSLPWRGHCREKKRG